MPDKVDIQPLIDARRAKAEQANAERMAQHKAGLQQAALKMEYVTQSAEWDAYLQHLQAMLNADERVLLATRDRLTNEESLSHEEIDALRLRIKRLVGRIEARTQDMAIPKGIIQQSKGTA